MGVSVIAYLPTDLTPRVSQWNLQVQREVGKNRSISLAYVGTLGDRLPRNYNANQQLYASPSGTSLFPNLGSITTLDNRGKSYYHSLQAQYERRMTNGLQFLGAFTWSKTIDDACGLDSCPPQLYTNFNLERALSNQDQPTVLFSVRSTSFPLAVVSGGTMTGHAPSIGPSAVGR